MSFLACESLLDHKRVLLSDSLVRGVRMLVIEGFTALRRRGLEVGGLLLGEPRGDPRGEEIRVDVFEEVPCEHRYGPSYALSENDLAKLSTKVKTRPAGTPPVVGFFRSFTSPNPDIGEADEALVREYFPKGDFVYLVLHPLSAENCVAHFRFFREGRVLPETGTSPFAFDPGQMSVQQEEAEPYIEPDMEIAPSEPPALPPPYRARLEATASTAAHIPAWAAEPAPRSRRWWVAAAICLLGLGAGVYYELSNTSPAPRWAELHLDASPVRGQLEISWDAAAQLATNATRGLLSFSDGNNHREVELTPEEIRAGKYSFSPSHSEVGVRLVLYHKDHAVAGDAIRVAEVPAAVAAVETRQPAEETRQPAESPREAVPPATVLEVQPRIPEGIRSRITEEVLIPVTVEVNKRGRVVRATADVQSSDSVHRYLAAAAQKAAREWRFRPARTRGGAPVAASKTIQFAFTP